MSLSKRSLLALVVVALLVVAGISLSSTSARSDLPAMTVYARH